MNKKEMIGYGINKFTFIHNVYVTSLQFDAEDTTQKWIHVSERLTLNNVLTKKNYVVPGAPG